MSYRGFRGGRRNYPQSNESDAGFGRKRRYSEPEDDADPAEKFVLHVGEKPDEDYTFAADHLLTNYSTSREKVLDALEICISEVSVKAFVYGKLVFAMNQKSPEFVQDLLMNLTELVEIRLKRAEFNQVLLILRFFAICTGFGVISLSSMIQILNELVQFGAANDNSVKEVLLRIMLPCFPLLVPKLQQKAPTFIDDFLGTCHNWMADLNCGGEVKFTASITKMEPIFAYWQSLLELKANEWQTDFNMSSDKGESVAEHDLRLLKLSLFIAKEKSFCKFCPFILDLQLNQDEQNMSLFHRLMLWENVRLTVCFFEINYKRGLETILSEVRNQPLEREYTYAFFSCLLSAHCSKQDIAKYLVSMITFCRLKPSIAPYLGRIIRFFYANCESLDYQVMFMFYEWITEQLTNFDLKWNWAEWLDCGENRSKQLFVEEILDRLSRNFYVDRIRKALPEDFHGSVTRLCNKTCDESVASDPATNRLAMDIRMKRKFEELFPGQPFSPDVFISFVRAVLVAGSATVSHSVAFFDMHKLTLSQTISNDPEYGVLLVREMFSFWKDNIQVFEVLVQKLILNKVIAPAAFLNAYFQVVPRDDFVKFKPWNVVFSVLKVVNLRISQCNERVAEIKKDFDEDYVNEEIQAINNALDQYNPQKELFFRVIKEYIEAVLQSSTDTLLSKTLNAIQRMI